MHLYGGQVHRLDRLQIFNSNSSKLIALLAPIMKLTILIMLLFLFNSCNSSDNKSIYIYHPTEENLDRDVSVSLSQSITSDQIDKQQVIEKLNNRQFLTSIGNLSGNESEIFSDFFQVETTESEIVIYERGSYRISRFDFKGNFISDIEATGRGPNELNQPLQISVSKDTLYVVDEGYEIKFLNLNHSEQNIETLFSTSNSLIEGICSLNEKFLIRFFSTNASTVTETSTILHLVNKESEEIDFSFGKPYKANNQSLSQVLSEGIISCNEAVNTVVATSFILPYIVAYNDQGEMIWIAEVENFRPIIYRQHNVPGGSVQFRWNNETFIHNTLEILGYKEYLIVQVTEFENFIDNENRSRNKELQIETFLIHSETGESAYLGSDLPRILAISENYLITEKDEEFPAIEVFAI
jgi:hypothetical protein